MEEVVVRRRAWDCGSPLYDSFELASVYGLLDSNLMALPFAERSAELDAAADRGGGEEDGQSGAPFHLQVRHLQQEAVKL